MLIYTINFLIGTLMRNLSIALAIALGVFGEKGADATLLIALAYIVQVQAAAWYVKFTDRLFGDTLSGSVIASESAKSA
jgi:hypothetical protein